MDIFFYVYLEIYFVVTVYVFACGQLSKEGEYTCSYCMAFFFVKTYDFCARRKLCNLSERPPTAA